jgi:MSHA biogenesis protein MshI
MRWSWPWRRKASTDRLVVSWSGQVLAYVQAQVDKDGKFVPSRMGVERQGSDSDEVFLARLQALGLQAGEVHAMLRTEQYQLLQIEAPAVPPEELRAAARYQIREMVETQLDDLTIDVMRVGDGRQKSPGYLYVVVAPNTAVQSLTRLAQSMRWPLTVIDIQETAQRNLQTAMALRDGLGAQANAVLVVNSERQALLTISANEELFYSRRLDLPEGFLDMTWSAGVEFFADEPEGFTPVGEYVPDYSGTTSFDYSAGATQGIGAGLSDHDRSQRFLVEVQRSLDLWERTWSGMPLSGLRIFASGRTYDLATWLSQEMGQTVAQLDLVAVYPQLADMTSDDAMVCLPLLGVLLRSQGATH